MPGCKEKQRITGLSRKVLPFNDYENQKDFHLSQIHILALIIQTMHPQSHI
jgi:hypothetical protein